ncbi:MAG: hypothetical protein HC886_23835 [Leptolyngbyaceae cyanobacterium SM1_1_3]|nr:hypothetical protein [Leptolyngbyaceae cyanobacterium SM1_1_3]NJN04381.1 hypothetical protein [Leptolyngbyaceae cyanobacterium RM1_1_2]NJO10810.1 hypothetical protein [Leptolyngbyaceae cyanobacterium SL_1_1]
MFQSSDRPIELVTVETANPQPNHRKSVRHMLLGDDDAVLAEIKNLHKRGHSEPNDWSQLLPTGRPDEVMAILTRHLWL